MAQKISGQVEGLLVSSDPKSNLSLRQAQVKATLEGFEGDRHIGLTMRSNARQPHYPRGTVIRNSRQISIVSVEELAQVAAAMDLPELLPEWLSANLSVRGIPNLTLLPPSSRLFFPGEAVLVIDSENTPCTSTGRSIQSQHSARPGLTTAFPKAARHKRGLVAWVERPGIVRLGDQVTIQLAPQIVYSI